MNYNVSKLFHFIFRYGDLDPELRNDYDMNIKLRMSAVQYVHTKRFQSELMAFGNHFAQIQESLRRMRTVAAGNEVKRDGVEGGGGGVVVARTEFGVHKNSLSSTTVGLIAQQVEQWTRFMMVKSSNLA